MLRSILAFSFCSFDGFNSEEKKGENEVVLNERDGEKGEYIASLKTRSLAKVLIRWVDRHVKNEGSDVCGLLEMID